MVQNKRSDLKWIIKLTHRFMVNLLGNMVLFQYNLLYFNNIFSRACWFGSVMTEGDGGNWWWQWEVNNSLELEEKCASCQADDGYDWSNALSSSDSRSNEKWCTCLLAVSKCAWWVVISPYPFSNAVWFADALEFSIRLYEMSCSAGKILVYQKTD